MWVSDDTKEGTKILRDIVQFGPNFGSSLYAPSTFNRKPYLFMVIGYFFNGKSHSTGIEFYNTDGTTDGAKLLTEVVKGPAHSYTADLVLYKENFYFGTQIYFRIKRYLDVK